MSSEPAVADRVIDRDSVDNSVDLGLLRIE